MSGTPQISNEDRAAIAAVMGPLVGARDALALKPALTLDYDGPSQSL